MHTLLISLGLLLSGLEYESALRPTISRVSPPGRCQPDPLLQNEDCTRGAAEPVVKKAVFPNTTFRLQPDQRTGIETVRFANGDRLQIKNWGCESYVLTFRFETTRFPQPPSDLAAWYAHAITLLRETRPGLHAPLDLNAGIRALTSYLARHKNSQAAPLRLDEEIGFGPETMPTVVTLDKVEKLAGNRAAVEVSLALGPL
ncbi:hypothetical protein E5K00_01855 [Hymenobacter aquaticus]|uniref:Uncharacterized protein n=1 Tax=Hymenobacter aquaticus TaxID=1867101 RepID=A0A4Z0Q316_9BACT|nr:hypothetical protein [Hymenobacter aquaticus]TGE23984.1 hypothetical protein E5K00_01855 [Hymenobacter aquaticus]